jgi:hypothetical protein
VTKTNYSELLRTAELYNIAVLKSAVLKFIVSNIDHLTS